MKNKAAVGKEHAMTPFAIKHDHPRRLSKPYRLANRVVTQRVYHFFQLLRKKMKVQFNKSMEYYQLGLVFL